MSHDATLEPVLRAVEPRARVIPERHLRQVLQYLADIGKPTPANTGMPFWIERTDLEAAHVLPQYLIEGADSPLLLVTDSVDRLISHMPRPEQLLAYWRVLFQAAVMREIDERLRAGWLTEDACHARLAALGSAAVREIRYVLSYDHIVPADVDAVGLYRFFAVVYLDLLVFDPERVEDFFPSLPSGEAQLLPDQEVALQVLRHTTRPAGAAEPTPAVSPDVLWAERQRCAETLPVAVPPEVGELHGQAYAAARKGNHIRAAILYTQLASAREANQERLLRHATSELGRVVAKLGELFGWDAASRREWGEALRALLAPAAVGVWPRAARCLYELQTIAADLTRDVYAVDLVEYIRTLGRRPVKRPLPLARRVQVHVHLKKAHDQMLRAGLDAAPQLRLEELFHSQMDVTERAIREEIGPVIKETFVRCGLAPGSKVEEVGFDKLAAELLDRICDRGYLRFGDLRDAIARNQLKLPDLAGPAEFFLGNALLRIDTALPYAIDGVYQRGEFYLRWIQRGSAFFFGTMLGRLITVFLFIPFGGAFLTLMFAEELRHIGNSLVDAVGPASTKAVPAPSSPPPQIAEPPEAPPPDPGAAKIHPDQVDFNGDSNEVEWNPLAVSSDDVEYTPDGGLIWTDTSLAKQVFTSSAPTQKHEEGSILIAWPTILSFGMFLLLVFHVSAFRRVVIRVLGAVWTVVRGILWDLPRAVWLSTAVRSLRLSWPVRFLALHFWSPFLISMLMMLTAFFIAAIIGVRAKFGVEWFLLRWGVWIWAGLTLAYNTPWGWVVQDRITEALSDAWRILRSNLIPGMIGAIIDWFRRLANWVETKLYAVDEWLRFRGGDSQGSLALKATLGLLWFPIAYTFRFVFFLLVEPQINPVKHFPVVTVSHKVIWPMVPEIAAALGVEIWQVALVVNGIPGIFGFIAWELKENWKLYRANRPPRLKPVIIGSHGETMRGLLRPGFHSGTLPKLYRKCRRADRARASRLHHDLAHVSEGIERFLERELIDLLQHCPAWGGREIEVEKLHFGCQRVVIELAAPGLGTDRFVFAVEYTGDVIEATIDQAGWGWADKLTGDQHAALVAAVRGMLDFAAVNVVNGRERIESPAPLGPGFDDLARIVTWQEWVARWQSEAVTEGRSRS